MSIATQISALQTDKTNIANAITTMGGTVTSGDGFDNFASDIQTIPQGGGGQTQTKSLSVTQNGSYTVTPDTGYTLSEVDVDVSVSAKPLEPKDITFYDWDGTVLYAYTFAEIQQLSALPGLVDYKDYTANSWTETLSFLQGLTTPFNVGVNYTTTRTGTKFYITVDDLRKDSVSMFNYSSNGANWNVDWGDGTTGTVGRGSKRTHSYSLAGDYVVTVTPASSSGKVLLRAQISNDRLQGGGVIYSDYDFTGLSGQYADVVEKSFYNSILKAVEPGVGTSGKFGMSDYGLICAYNVTKMIIPKGSKIDRWGFRYTGFEFISFPSTGTIGSQAYPFGFQEIKKLKRVVLPSVFEATSGIVAWHEGSSQSNVAQSLFKGCQSLVEYLPTTIYNGSLYGFDWRRTQDTFAGYINSAGALVFPFSLNLERLVVPENITTMNNTLGTLPIIDSITASETIIDIHQMPLKYLHLPSTLTTMSNEDFSMFYNLREVHFPASLTSLSNVVLPEIAYFYSTTPPDISGGLYLGITKIIYVPAESLNDYLNDPYWSTYYSIIQAEPS